MSVALPYLTVVATSRNDNHGGDLTRRTQIFIDALVQQAERHKVPTELILIEWNPPKDRVSLQQELRWPAHNEWCEIRLITVARKVHRQFGYSKLLPMFQMIAKNVGVRRARGQFVLQTNIDIIFSDAMFAWIARRLLKPGVLYRCDRVDVDRNVPTDTPIGDLLGYCASHVLRVAKRDAMWVVPPGMQPALISDAQPVPWTVPEHKPTQTVGHRLRVRGERFLLRLEGTADALVTRRRLLLAELVGLVKGSLILSAAFGWFIGKVLAWIGRLTIRLPILRRLHANFVSLPQRSRVVRLLKYRLPAAVRDLRALGYRPTLSELVDHLLAPRRRIPSLHTNACGDFLLADAASWKRMRGTPELSIFSMYLDSLALMTAYKVGLTIQNLPSDRVIYHIDHGSGWTPNQHIDLYRRINKMGVPIISHSTYLRYAENLIKTPDYFLSTDEWGLGKQELPEITVTRRVSVDDEHRQSESPLPPATDERRIAVLEEVSQVH